jgi:hypothetical protein
MIRGLTAVLVLAWSAGQQTSPAPPHIVLLVDTSDSMTSHVPFRRGDRTLLTDAAAALADSFGPAINVTPPRLQRDEIARAADALNDGTGGASPLWDALDAAVRSLDGISGQRGVIVVTDGRTTGNTLAFSEILQRLEKTRVPVFVLCAERPKQLGHADPSIRLRQIAGATGGEYFVIASASSVRKPKPEALRRAVNHAVDAIRKAPASR